MASVINIKYQANRRLCPFHFLSKDVPGSLFPSSSGPWHGVLWTYQWRPVVTEMLSPYFPGMIGYGMAKGAVHQLCQSLAGKDSGMPSGSAAIAVLP